MRPSFPLNSLYPADMERNLNVHKTFRRGPGSFLNVLCAFNLRPASTGRREKKVDRVNIFVTLVTFSVKAL